MQEETKLIKIPTAETANKQFMMVGSRVDFWGHIHHSHYDPKSYKDVWVYYYYPRTDCKNPHLVKKSTLSDFKGPPLCDYIRETTVEQKVFEYFGKKTGVERVKLIANLQQYKGKAKAQKAKDEQKKADKARLKEIKFYSDAVVSYYRIYVYRKMIIFSISSEDEEYFTEIQSCIDALHGLNQL